MPKSVPEEKAELSKEQENVYRTTIEAVESPLRKILEAIRPDIQKGAYRIIIGDDASGRLPALILNRVISAAHEKEGYEKPLLRFIAGSTGLNSESKDVRENKKDLVRSHIARIAEDAGVASEGIPMLLKSLGLLPKDKKVLIVTDTVDTGESIRVLLKALAANNLSGDVVTIADLRGRSHEPRLIAGTPVYNGGKTRAPQIYDRRYMSGVVKEPKDLFSTPSKGTMVDPSMTQAEVNFSREVASEIAERLAREYLATP